MGTDDTTASQDASTANGDGNVTACMLIIGNELLSGRTQDKNLSFLGIALGEIGIDMREARIIPDDPAIIVETLNTCRARFDYVFTTGGIGPTHDDITADCVAEAFGVPLEYHPVAMAQLTAHYEIMGTEFNEARQRMARIP
ncbi:MAG: competence/damage-inducible protein A, partial [Pseudomonadota bacterium]|nr:competence/damage-inducible protein A [Pseudomonadota bacterium]